MTWKVGEPYVDACHCGQPKHVRWANCNDCLRDCNHCRAMPGGFAVVTCACDHCSMNILGNPPYCSVCYRECRGPWIRLALLRFARWLEAWLCK